MSTEYLMLALAATAVALVGYGLTRLLVRPGSAQLEQRLAGGRATEPAVTPSGPSVGTVLLDRIGRIAGRPFAPKAGEELSKVRQQLGYAGYYSTSAIHLPSGAKAIALAIGLVGGYLLGTRLGQPLLGFAIGGAAGLWVPRVWLDALIRTRRQALEHALPDAIDLMVVCVEAGLTIDAAMQRVGREINMAHPVLARELAIAHMEAQMGLPRSDALRNLGRRTGSPAIQSLVAMLVQAERFGTSIAQTLRIHAESLRIKRQYAAEETAAKAAVKILFPLVFFIFPAMLIVIVGPGVIKIIESGIFAR